MRADRLLSLLMLLQTRGRMTAQALAHELEVSERTIYRDLEALSIAGIPVYADRGPGGGCMLLDNYRTTLTGLTEDEARALFMVTLPAPLDKLGVGQELKTARLKLLAAMPHIRREDEAEARQRIHLDSTWWFQSDTPTPHLQTLHEAVWQNQRLQIVLQIAFGHFEAQLERELDAYGLVAKASVWYVVGVIGERLRAYPVSQILEAHPNGEHFARPADFDLAVFWKGWCQEHEASRPQYFVTARAAPDMLPYIHRFFGEHHHRTAEQALADADGRLTVTLCFASLEEARNRLLGLGSAIEVVAPEALRWSIVDIATQTLRRYS